LTSNHLTGRYSCPLPAGIITMAQIQTDGIGYDRFSALQQILGQRYFAVFQKNYYRGYSPIVYFQKIIDKTYYIPRYKVRNTVQICQYK
jgi:hypothetical protein